jgi:hypothetical protein
LSHALLVQAEQNRWHDERRAAVIDAANAADVALSNNIARALKARGLAQDAVQPVIAQVNGLAGLMRLHQDLGCALDLSQQAVRHRVAGPRNRAAHAGTIPTEAETLSAVRTARAVVESADPLPEVTGTAIPKSRVVRL